MSFWPWGRRREQRNTDEALQTDLAGASPLPARAAAFLLRPIPEELRPQFVPGSICEIIVTHCAQKMPLDREMLDLAAICVMELEDSIQRASSEDLKTYYLECQVIIRTLLASGGRSVP